MTPKQQWSPPRPAPILLTEQTNSFQKIALGLLLSELFILYTRIFDLFASGLRIPAINLVLLAVTALISGKLFRGLEGVVGRLMLALAIWVTIVFPFSIWRTGSIPGVEGIWQSVFLFAAVAGLASTVKDTRRIMYALGLTSFVASLLSFQYGFDNGRLTLSGGTFHDPNEYCMCLLMGVPFWWLMSASTRLKPMKIIPLLVTLPIFWVMARTGSRGGSLGLLAVIIVHFVASSAGKKLVLIAATGIGLLTIVSVIPNYLKERYVTYFSTDKASLEGDASSGAARRDLVFKSIVITLQHPMVGVGPGNFPVAFFEDAKVHGKQYAWVVTHNTFTQISSETGIPGLVIFLALVIYSFKSLSQVLKLTGPKGSFNRPDIFATAQYLRLSLIAVTVCMIFLAVGFMAMIYIFFGLAAGVKRATLLEMSKAQAPIPETPRQLVVQPRFAPAPVVARARDFGLNKISRY